MTRRGLLQAALSLVTGSAMAKRAAALVRYHPSNVKVTIGGETFSGYKTIEYRSREELERDFGKPFSMGLEQALGALQS